MGARCGQTILEYTMLIGIITVVLFYMGTGIKRGVQSLVKVTADQMGNQQNSDQDFNDTMTGYMEGSNAATEEVNNKEAVETGWRNETTGAPYYVSSTLVNEYSETVTNTTTNGGFAPTLPGGQ